MFFDVFTKVLVLLYPHTYGKSWLNMLKDDETENIWLEEYFL